MLQLGQLYLRLAQTAFAQARAREGRVRARHLARDAGTPRQRSGVKPRSSEQGEDPIRISFEKGFDFPMRELQRDLALGGKFAGALAVVIGIGGAFLAGPTRRTR
jgi:hypothetical protein